MTSTEQAPMTDAAWRVLHERIHAFVARRVSRSDTDDLVQDVLLRLHEHVGRLRERDRLEAWAYQIARNRIADHWRSRGALRDSLLDDHHDDLATAVPEGEDAESAETRAELARCVQPLVERLAEPYREAILLTDLGDGTQSDAAAQLGVSVPGMKSRVQRGRAKLEAMLRACCRIELDRRGGVFDVEQVGSCGATACGCAGSPA
jgi:RNA polymerase sigma-70 factor, ECF subfamily